VAAWRLTDRRCLPLTGYTRKVSSTSWSGSKWLATSGSQYLELWPFQQPNNPMMGIPLLLAGYAAVATAVSCHPTEEVIAVGYQDGAALLIRIEDEAEILIKQPGGSPVVRLTWNERGDLLALVSEDGCARIVDIEFSAGHGDKLRLVGAGPAER
jgi:WD40 repeat protein